MGKSSNDLGNCPSHVSWHQVMQWIQIHILRSEHFTTNGSPLLSFAKFHSKSLRKFWATAHIGSILCRLWVIPCYARVNGIATSKHTACVKEFGSPWVTQIFKVSLAASPSHPWNFWPGKLLAGNPMESVVLFSRSSRSGCGSNGQTKDPNQNANQNGHLKSGKCDLSRWDDLFSGPGSCPMDTAKSASTSRANLLVKLQTPDKQFSGSQVGKTQPPVWCKLPIPSKRSSQPTTPSSMW